MREEAIVEEKKGEHEDEVIQEGVVSGEDDAELPGRDEEE